MIFKNSLHNTFKVLIVFFIAMVVGGPAFSEPLIGAAAPQFKLIDEAANSVTLDSFKGKYLVLHWTNPGCPFIKRHYQQNTFAAISEKYKNSPVAVVAVDSSHFATAESIKATHTEQKLSYPILLDADGSVGKLYGAKTTPHVFIVDKDGKLVYRGAVDDDGYGEKGAAAENYVSKALDELLAGKEVTNADNKSYGCSVKYK